MGNGNNDTISNAGTPVINAKPAMALRFSGTIANIDIVSNNNASVGPRDPVQKTTTNPAIEGTSAATETQFCA